MHHRMWQNWIFISSHRIIYLDVSPWRSNRKTSRFVIWKSRYQRRKFDAQNVGNLPVINADLIIGKYAAHVKSNGAPIVLFGRVRAQNIRRMENG